MYAWLEILQHWEIGIHHNLSYSRPPTVFIQFGERITQLLLEMKRHYKKLNINTSLKINMVDLFGKKVKIEL